MSDANKGIVFLKSKKTYPIQDDEYHELVSRTCGFQPHSIPVIDFVFINSDELTTTIKSIESFAAIIFTSPRAVEALAIALSKIDGLDKLKKVVINKLVSLFVVGKATKKKLSKLGLKSEGAETESADKLAKYILEQKNCDIYAKQVLFLHGNLARDTLPCLLHPAKVSLQSLCVYETVPHPSFIDNFNTYLRKHGDPAVLAFFSPSGAEFYLEKIIEMTDNFENIKIVAIGKTTSKSLENLKCHVHAVAEKPTAECLVRSIKLLLEVLT